MKEQMKTEVPREVQEVASALGKAGFQAFLVGGCLRDLIMNRVPKDWDVATNATPSEIQKLFPESVYENAFGTVGVKTESEDPRLKIIEITTFRIEGTYSDARHPDEVTFAETIEDDLKRRDFTMNAFALELSAKKGPGRLVDPHGGLKDIEAKIIRTVGDPHARFREDALRMLRAIRFAADLEFTIAPETDAALRDEAHLLEVISHERVRDEFQKMIMTPRAAGAIVALEDAGLLKYVLPELRNGIGVAQNKHHVYTVFDHNVHALNYAAEKGYSFEVRLASLLHDVGKPRSKRGEGEEATFHGHESIGAKMALTALDRLRFSKEIVEKVGHLIRYHMFYYNVGEVSAAGVRRFVRRVGPEHIDDLMRVREADRIGSKVPKAFPYKLRHLLFMIEKVKHDPIHPKMLALRGDGLMDMLSLPPGPRVGMILSILLEDVLDDPERNTRAYLEARAKELGALTDAALKERAEDARQRAEEAENEVESGMKTKYHVQ